MKRRRRRADGTYSDEESYHSDMDAEGKKRRQKRRNERKTVALKEAKKKFDAGGRRPGKAELWVSFIRQAVFSVIFCYCSYRPNI